MTKTLHELAVEHDQIALTGENIDPDLNRYKQSHRVAAFLHGWAAHEHNYGPVRITSEAYVEALRIADAGTLEPHEAALPKV